MRCAIATVMEVQPKLRFPDFVEAVPHYVGIPNAIHLKRFQRQRAEGPITEHTHPSDKMEFIYMAHGLQTHVAGKKTYKMKGGDVLVIFPGEKHSSGGTPQEKSLICWLGIRIPKKTDDFLSLPLPQSRLLATSLKNTSPRHFEGSPALQRHLDDVISDMSITEIAHATGFSSAQNFATAFKRFMGITPRQVRKFHFTHLLP